MQIRNVFGQSASRTAHNYTQAAADFVNTVSEKGKEKIIEGKDKVLNYTTEHPAKAIGWSMLTGAVAGYLLTRRNHKDED